MTEKTNKIHIEIMKGESGISSFGGFVVGNGNL